MKSILLTLLIILSVSCNSQEKKAETAEIENLKEQTNASQIGQYVIETFQDSKGNLWFGTLEKGVAKYDGNKLVYITTKDGLPSNRIASVIEDYSGNLWFGTGAGLSKFDGKTFKNYSEKDGLCSDMISNLFIDSKENFWIGTWGGVCKFNGSQFENFPIPYPKTETKINQDTKDWITEIAEDTKGNIWFARDGYGATKYDGKNFSHYLKKDGLHSNNVTEIEIDKDGDIWFGTRVAEKDNPDPKKRKGKGGVNKLTKNGILSFPEIEGFNNDDVYEIYNNNFDNLWISTTSNGVYQFDGKKFKNYNVPISIMGMNSDKKGNLWLGGAGGLYKIDKKGKVINVTTNGPWK